MNSLTFKLGETYFTLEPEAFTTSEYVEGKGYKCAVMVSTNDDVMILGNPFLRAFDTVFDYTQSRLRFSLGNDALGATSNSFDVKV